MSHFMTATFDLLDSLIYHLLDSVTERVLTEIRLMKTGFHPVGRAETD